MATTRTRRTGTTTRGTASNEPVPLRQLGRTGEMVSALGLGGYHLALAGSAKEATRIIHAAIEAGVTFLDNAWEYHDGTSEEYMGKALAGGWRERVFLMTKVCTHGRDAKVAMRQLEQSLKRLKTDHLDLWQVHECVYHNDPERHYARGGVLEALDRAKREGKVRFAGFTGHKSPMIHLDMLARGYPFDTVQMPLNCFDATFRSFEQAVLPEVNRLGMAALGMKSLGGKGEAVKAKAVSPQDALRYAMSLPVAVTISGIDSMRVLRQNLRVAQGFTPFSERQMAALRKRSATLAADGRFELYKVTALHEGPIGRKEHGFPSDEEVAA